MERVTDKDLEYLVARINKITDSPQEPWTSVKGKAPRANIGCFHLDHAYGGVSLHRMRSESGGVIDVLNRGHVSKRELKMLMLAFIEGLMFFEE